MVLRHPLKFQENRVWRVYTGGWLLEQFLGKAHPREGHFPEYWIGSTILARNPNHKQGLEGLSFVILPNGERCNLKTLLEQAPTSILGEAHYRKYGTNPGILIKLLDASVRLPIQVHPDKSLALKYFSWPFGKTEAWLVLTTKDINGDSPYILLGFREGVSWKRFVTAVKESNSSVLEQCLHRLVVQPGDVYLIKPGIPHAIGPGSLILEIQEPTDITIRAEKKIGDIVISDDIAYQGLSLEQSLECYHFEPISIDTLLKRYKLRPKVIKECPGQGREQWLISYSDTPCFALSSLQVTSYWEVEPQKTFHIMIVLQGKGFLIDKDLITVIQKGECFLIPAYVPYRIETLKNNELIIVNCWPPL
ncbi:mannose-6-phosphate isomerase [Thermanaeromonas toyohensis ToBE]|uniref:Mannose-6-phosphate isomerase n=1 Tax=Thermanaeromonas toyohensis ToBE TaxID=698762 RepID=A0A1W1VV92_9FIRM|nr:mannose-6-phosphate isomerase [Thermanaeromonas toyohensis ToBE]